jgi:hypothetical protein
MITHPPSSAEVQTGYSLLLLLLLLLCAFMAGYRENFTNLL